MLVLFYFTASFLSAFLLFGVQPMIAKFLLPTLGGTPAVWNVCMLFFQILLLLGYLYAHYSTKLLGIKRQSALHIALFVAAALLAPISLTLDVQAADPTNHPILWQLTLLMYNVGVPFFLLSATSPLLQRWFSVSSHRMASNPYVLFSSSNLGSLVALIGYPFFIEPQFGLKVQAGLLQQGIFLQILLMAATAAGLWLKRGAITTPLAQEEKEDAPAPSRHEIFRWVGLAAIPSSILYGLTSFITTDIAAVPLLWVLPLTIYLLTFVIIFLSPRSLKPFFSVLHPPAVLCLLWQVINPLVNNAIPLITSHLLYCFIIMLACHSYLAELKPARQHLTSFYCWMAFGGIVGGAFNTLLAPVIFNDIAEYPIAIVLSLVFFVPWKKIQQTTWEEISTPQAIRYAVLGILVCAMIYFPEILMNYDDLTVRDYLSFALMFPIIIWAALVSLKIRSIYTFCLAATIMYGGYHLQMALSSSSRLLFQDRNFYAVHKVRGSNSTHRYTHGTTVHGLQSRDKNKELYPSSYYVPLKAAKAALAPGAAKAPISLLGLGIGTVLCYTDKNQEMDVYEIDDMVVRIARDSRLFTYYEKCPGTHHLIMGDARLKMSHAPDGRYGMMVMDAFTSDAVPIHLLTVEAVAMYKKKLHPDGIMAFHITNAHLSLEPVLANIAKANGLHGYIKRFDEMKDPILDRPSVWVVLASNPEIYNRLDGWRPIATTDSVTLWTDDYSNIVSALKYFRKN